MRQKATSAQSTRNKKASPPRRRIRVRKGEGAGSYILRLAAEARKHMSPDDWKKVPRDLSINHDHYLYGTPKVEE